MSNTTIKRIALAILAVLAAVIVLADPCHREPEPDEQHEKG